MAEVFYTGYDFPLVGNEPDAFAPGSEDMPFGPEYRPESAGIANFFKTFNTMETPAPSETPSSDFFSDFKTALTSPLTQAKQSAGSMFESVSKSIRNSWLYLVGGLLLVGVVVILVIGAGSRFLQKVEGS